MIIAKKRCYKRNIEAIFDLNDLKTDQRTEWNRTITVLHMDLDSCSTFIWDQDGPATPDQKYIFGFIYFRGTW